MANIKTKLEHLIDPQVLADMVLAELPHAIRFTGVAPVDTTLKGRAGSTVTVPAYKYIGEAVEIGEGETYPVDQLETSTEEFTIKKYGKAVGITDESLLSAEFNPATEIQRQLVMAIKEKIDNDTLAQIKTATVTANATLDATIVDTIEETFDDEGDDFGVIFMSVADAIALRNGAMEGYTRSSALGDNVLAKGNFGEVLGWEIVRSNKLKKGEAYAVKAGALKTLIKREMEHEFVREALNDNNIFKANLHGNVVKVDDSKLIKLKVAKATKPAPEGE